MLQSHAALSMTKIPVAGWGSAYAEFQDDVKGTLEVGKAADFVVISDDIFTIDPVKIRDAKVLVTVVDGRVAYERGPKVAKKD
jgi:predicted amidohydrolase YtcJ